MRFKDWVLIIGAVAGMVAGFGKMFVLANSVEIQQKKLDAIEPLIAIHTTQIAVNDERWSQIQSQLKEISRKIDKR